MSHLLFILPVLILGLLSYFMLPKSIISLLYFKEHLGGGESEDSDEFRCRATILAGGGGDSAGVLKIEIIGLIASGENEVNKGLNAQIALEDVTDGARKAREVRDNNKVGKPGFASEVALGRLPRGVFLISEWTNIAEINTGSLLFAKRGRRKVRLRVSIRAQSSGERITSAESDFYFDERRRGYEYYEEDSQRARTLAIALGFSVSAADKKIYKVQFEVIRKWVKRSFELERCGRRVRRKFEKSLEKSLQFFREGNRLDTFSICRELAEIAPLSLRVEIVEFCLEVAGANGIVVPEEVKLLKEIGKLLEVDAERFNAKMEKLLPVTMHQERDPRSFLNLDEDMTGEQKGRILTREYSKWNARVCNSDPEIRKQADLMLSLIAEAKEEFASAGAD